MLLHYYYISELLPKVVTVLAQRRPRKGSILCSTKVLGMSFISHLENRVRLWNKLPYPL
jgi:hypothetical protein